jgi:C4-dicarboxylate-binding protein DctP
MKLHSMLFGLIALGLTQGALAQQPIVIKFSHVVAPDTPKGKAAEFFKERAEELPAGKVKVEVYPNSQLYKDKEELEALQLGVGADAGAVAGQVRPARGVKEFEVFDLPFIFDGYADLHKVTEGADRQGPAEEAGSQGHHRPGFWDNGFKVNSRPTSRSRTPADF